MAQDAAVQAALAQLAVFHSQPDELVLEFAPAALAPEQRNLVRMRAVEMGMKGKSRGGGQARRLVVTKPGYQAQQKDQQQQAAPEPEPEPELGPSLVHDDHEDPNSSVVFLRKLPRSVDRQALRQLGARFGTVTDTILLHGRGQCVLQLDSTASASALLEHYASQPLVLNGKKVLVQRGAQDITRTPVVIHRHILREVRRALPPPPPPPAPVCCEMLRLRCGTHCAAELAGCTALVSRRCTT
jgi:hypothetical protein